MLQALMPKKKAQVPSCLQPTIPVAAFKPVTLFNPHVSLKKFIINYLHFTCGEKDESQKGYVL